MLSPVPLFCILLTRTITKRAVAWVGSGQPECTVPLGKWNFRNFEPEFLLNGKRPRLPFSDFQRHFEHVMNKESVGKRWHRVEYRWQGLVEVYNSWQRLVSGSESYKTLFFNLLRLSCSFFNRELEQQCFWATDINRNWTFSIIGQWFGWNTRVNRLYKRKETWQYKFVSAKADKTEERLTSSWRASLKNVFA